MTAPTQGIHTYCFSFDASEEEVRRKLSKLPIAQKIRPRLVLPQEVRSPNAYNRFLRLSQKELYRRRLHETLAAAWQKNRGKRETRSLLKMFDTICGTIQNQGAVPIAGLVPKRLFSKFVNRYDKAMAKSGSHGLLHSYLNLKDHLDLVADREISSAFMHPMLIAVVSYCIGAPIRLVDARAKDTGPFEVRAQDNMLHIDNTPFNDEYKILLLWKKGTTSGPDGQNFVYVPGTHRAARDCMIDDLGVPYSTENASIFVDADSISDMFAMQRNLLRTDAPTVIEVSDPKQPIAVAFAAGSLVHHRYRTSIGADRSCLILAFHSAQDARGVFTEVDCANAAPIARQVICCSPDADSFFDALRSESHSIAQCLSRLAREANRPYIVDQNSVRLTGKDFEAWRSIACSAPEIEEIKGRQSRALYGQEVSETELAAFIAREMIFFDKHGPLDLILYADAHEEIRKSARNRIREMPLPELVHRVKDWTCKLKRPNCGDILSPQVISNCSKAVTEVLSGVTSGCELSAKQLSEDLSEAIRRPYSLQNFLSTSLFIFLLIDHTRTDLGIDCQSLQAMGIKLLNHYVSLSVEIQMTEI